jgi:ABC-2 type transport system permease protein
MRRSPGHRGRIAAIVRRDVLVLRTYPLQLLLGLVQSLAFVVSFYFIGQFVGQPAALAGTDPGYFEFALVGVVVVTVVGLALGEFTANLSEEQSAGTLESLLATPVPLWNVLAGGAVVAVCLTAVDVVVLTVVGAALIGGVPSVPAVAGSAVLLALLFVCFAAVGVAAAGVIVVVKRGDPLSGPVNQVTGLLSGAYFPVSVLPGWLQPIAHLVPATYALRGIRELVIGEEPLSAAVDELLVLGAMALVAAPASVWFFGRAVGAARRAGSLGHY